MRENIGLFHAKKKCNNEWVEGYLIKKISPISGKDKYYILTQEFNTNCSAGHITTYKTEMTQYEVIPETIGEFCGLCDLDGKKIFEGQILKDVSDAGEGKIYEVYYNEYLCAFMLDDQYWITPTRDWLSDEDRNPTTLMLRIIGNIIDNPELISDDIE